MSFYTELKRRNVFRVAVAYLAAAWLLTEVAGTVLPIFGFGDGPARVVIILLAIGFPLFLVFSWVFEFTPQGLMLEKEIADKRPAVRWGVKKLDRAIIVLLALALGYFAVDKFVLEPARLAEVVEEATQKARSEVLVESYGERSIAVLPFVNMSADPEQEYFSDGISEELLNLLAQISELRVISRSSSFSFKGKEVAVPEIARQLNVANVLEGSVRRVGDRVRISAQLIEARSDTHLWSETFERELGDIFKVQDEIALAISHALRLRLVEAGGHASVPKAIETANITAYDAYLQARELVRLRGVANLRQAVNLLYRALLLDEGFAPAHAQLAIAGALLAFQEGFDREEIEQHVDRAEELEPDLADIYVARALFAGDPASQVAFAQRALALNPNQSDAMNTLYLSLSELGRYEEADEAMQQMLTRDPLTVVGRFNYAEWLGEKGRVAEAHQLADQLAAQSPLFAFSSHATASLVFEGKVAEGLYWGLKAGPGKNNSVFALFWLGMFDEVRRLTSHGQPWIDVIEGRYDAAIDTVRDRLQNAPNDNIAVWTAAEILYSAGHIGEALPLYERLLNAVPKGRPILSPLPYWCSSDDITMRLALARRNADDEDGAQAAAQIARQDHAALREAGASNQFQERTEAMLAAFDRDNDRAIAALESAVRLGLRDRQVLDDAIFEELRGEPRFIALKNELDRILGDEHEKVLQLICFNNPVPDVWQPMTKTCQGVDRKAAVE